MFQERTIGVVVPAYNEAHLIDRVIRTMPALVDHIIVVDDASTDRTAAVVEEVQAEPGVDGRLTLIRLPQNEGVGGAIVAGYREALAKGVDVVAVMAGDAQMDPEELSAVIGPVVGGQADYVKGNRLFTGEAWNLIPRVRYLGNAALSLLTKISSGYWHVADSQTGYTAISAEMLARLPLERLYRRYGYPNHILAMLNVQFARVMDVPVRPVYNIGEKSGIRIWKIIPQLSVLLLRWFLWRLKERYIIRDFHPLVFFYLMAFGLFLVGVPLTGRLVFRWWLDGFVPPTNALALMVTTIMGFQALLFAMWFDMDYNRHLAVSDRRSSPGGKLAARVLLPVLEGPRAPQESLAARGPTERAPAAQPTARPAWRFPDR